MAQRLKSLQCRRPGFDPWVGKIPWRRKWQPTPVLLPGESHGQRSLVGYSPWSHKESDMTEQLHSLMVKNIYLEKLFWFSESNRVANWFLCTFISTDNAFLCNIAIPFILIFDSSVFIFCLLYTIINLWVTIHCC